MYGCWVRNFKPLGLNVPSPILFLSLWLGELVFHPPSARIPFSCHFLNDISVFLVKATASELPATQRLFDVLMMHSSRLMFFSLKILYSISYFHSGHSKKRRNSASVRITRLRLLSHLLSYLRHLILPVFSLFCLFPFFSSTISLHGSFLAYSLYFEFVCSFFNL